MTRRQNRPDEIQQALAAADRKPGWNNRPREVKQFELGNCLLYVVPYRLWAYRRQELRTAAWQESQRQG